MSEEVPPKLRLVSLNETSGNGRLYLTDADIISFAQSARRHRIGYAHARYVMLSNPIHSVDVRPSGEREFTWVAPDDRGVELEIIAVEVVKNRVLVIHVIPTALMRRSHE